MTSSTSSTSASTTPAHLPHASSNAVKAMSRIDMVASRGLPSASSLVRRQDRAKSEARSTSKMPTTTATANLNLLDLPSGRSMRKRAFSISSQHNSNLPTLPYRNEIVRALKYGGPSTTSISASVFSSSSPFWSSSNRRYSSSTSNMLAAASNRRIRASSETPLTS